MSTTSQTHEICPFHSDPRPEAKRGMYWLVVFTSASIVGWLSNWLTAALLTIIAAYGCYYYLAARKLLDRIASLARANGRDWKILRSTRIGDIPALASEPNASLLLKAAAALIQGQAHAGSAQREAVVDAVLCDLTNHVERIDTAAHNCPRMGLGGTAIGLLILYSGLEGGGDTKELVASVFTAIGGMQLAVSTTLVGVGMEWLLSIQYSAADNVLNEMRSQMFGQLSLLKLED